MPLIEHTCIVICEERIGRLKETHDEANMYCDIRKAIFALGVLGVRDMHKLWGEISKIAAETGSIDALRQGLADDRLLLDDREAGWLDIIESQIESIPNDEAKFIAEIADECEKLNPKLYDLI